MEIWILQTGEPVHSDQDNSRPMRAMNLANKLVERGHRVVLWTSAFHHRDKRHRYKEHTEINISENLQIRLVPSSGYKRNISISRFYDHCVLAHNIRRRLRTCENNPDVAFVGYPPIEAAYVMGQWLKKRNIPYLLDVKDQWPNILVDSVPKSVRFFARILLQPYYFIAKKTMKNATGICAHTSGYVNWSLAFSNKEKSSADLVAPLSAPNDLISTKEMADALNWWANRGIEKTRKFRVIFVGTFSRAFDFKTVFSAAAKLKNKNIDCEFVLCGEGERVDELRSATANLENIKIIGWIDRPKIVALSHISALTIAPYKNTYDFSISIPNKIIDSLLLGLPILSSLQGVVSDLISQHKIGLSYMNTSDLFDCVKTLERDCQIHKEMSKNAKNLYKSDFDCDTVYSALSEKLENLKAHE